MGAAGRVFMWGGSNGANSVQIFAANAGPALPIAAISCGWGQLMAQPPRSGPAPFDWNQPTPKPGQKPAGRPGDGRRVAQQAHHGDADTTIPYQGGPRFGSKIWILDSEPASDKVWSEHNGCTGPLTNPQNTSAEYADKETHRPVQTTAVKWVWTGCPSTAPVEYWQIIGAPHGGAHLIDGRDPFWIVFDFWGRVENATMAKAPSNSPAPPVAGTCSPQKACDFVKALNVAKKGDTVSLVCTATEACTISGMQLGREADSNYVEATVVMQNVLIQNHKVVQAGGLLAIDVGSVTGTNLTFRNGTAGDWGGCVVSFGRFSCTDCVFDRCSTANTVSGGVYSWGESAALRLVRPTFSGDTSVGVNGSGCYCNSADATKCVGCTCEKGNFDGVPGWYCSSGARPLA